MSGEATRERAQAAKEAAYDAWSKVAQVVGVGVTRSGDGWAVKVNLAAAGGRGPSEVDGVPVVVEITGVPRKRRLA